MHIGSGSGGSGWSAWEWREWIHGAWVEGVDAGRMSGEWSWCRARDWREWMPSVCRVNDRLSHRRSVALLCMLYKIRCNPLHPLCGALPVPYIPVRVTRGALIAHRYTYAPPRCRTSQYRRTFIPLSVSLWNALVDSVFDGVGLAGFKTRSNAFLLA